jgi:hypothetical protein
MTQKKYICKFCNEKFRLQNSLAQHKCKNRLKPEKENNISLIFIKEDGKLIKIKEKR